MKLPILLLVLLLAACSPAPEEEREVLYWYDPMHPQQRFDEPGPSPFMDMELVPRYAEEAESGPALDLSEFDAAGSEFWTCPMHPQIREDGPGRCPICSMNLVRRGNGEPGEPPEHIRVAPGVQQLMNLRTAEVRLSRLWRRIDTVGAVGYDQSRLHHIHSRVEGWIQEMDIAAAGDPVSAGQRLFTLYSPALVQAQEELLQALRRGEPGLINSARQRLAALGVQPAFMEDLESRGRSVTNVPWHAMRDGVVTQLNARHGMFTPPDLMILETADLSRVWVTAEVFDRNADWLAMGQPAQVRLSYRPGETLEGEIAYIYPQLDPVTRAVRVRVVLDNPGLSIRPGMWADVRILAGPVEDQIIIPREALIRTGHSERVVLREDDARFRVREVVAGMESGDYVAIREGLEPGETVVTSGQFLIDSEASLRAGHRRLEAHAH